MSFTFVFILGADPKSVFCAFFKQGLCKKGEKCKFSHDPAVERKSAKRNIYLDDEKDAKEDDNMHDILKKHGAEKSNQTDHVSYRKSPITAHIGINQNWASYNLNLKH